MLLQVENVLSPEIVAQMHHSMDQATWVDGRVTAGHQSGTKT